MALPRIPTLREAGPRLAAVALLLITSLAARPSRAQHVFDYAFDSFAVDGNHYGTLDGVPDLVEGFTTFGTFTPLLGTSQVSGGLLHLTNPGSHVALLGPTGTGVDLEMSLVLNSGGPLDGNGNFTATAVLKQQALAVNDAVTFGATGINIEAVALALSNFDATLSAATGVEQGYALSLLFLNTSVVPQRVLEVFSVAIDPGDVTGDVVFKMDFNDASNLLTASFSLDGGASFQTPFAPMAIFRHTSTYNFLLYADPQSLGAVTTTTVVTTTTTTSSSIAMCGNGARSFPEQCDDGNTSDGDGCSATCMFEPGWACAGQPSVCHPAVDHTVLGKQLQIKDPTLGANVFKRKLVGQGTETDSPVTIVGDPRIGGATVTFSAEGATPSTQTMVMPAVHWTAASTNSFKYTALTLSEGGPTTVKQATLKRSPSGTFRMTVTVNGKILGPTPPVTVVPPNPGTGGCVLLTINGGDRYHMRFGSDALITNNDAASFVIKKPTSAGLCP